MGSCDDDDDDDDDYSMCRCAAAMTMYANSLNTKCQRQWKIYIVAEMPSPVLVLASVADRKPIGKNLIRGSPNERDRNFCAVVNR